MSSEKYLELFSQVYNKESSFEKALAAIKNAGASPLESIRIVKNTLDISIPEAKEKVGLSEIWQDQRESLSDFSNHAADLFEQIHDIPNWYFEIEEVSANVYKCVGKDNLGHKVEATGTDCDKLLEKCKTAALKIIHTTKSD